MKILVFHATGAYQYGAVDRFLLEIEQGFMKLGHETLVVDVKSPDFVARTQQRFAQEPAFVFTFNGAGHLLQIEGKSLFDVIGTPFFKRCRASWDMLFGMSVLIEPGAIAFTRTEGASIVAIQRVSCRRPPLLAAYAAGFPILLPEYR